jgi:tRNA1Val (adenine37-N6)-methyltransferase
MMAQKTQQQAAAVHALDIDAASVTQATANAAASPWAHRLSVHLCSLQDWTQSNSHNSYNSHNGQHSQDTSAHRCETESAQTNSSLSSSRSDGGKHQRYDVIISNPPYFLRSSKPDASHRAAARHADVTLPFADLAQCSAQLLAPGGRLFVVLPVAEAQVFVGEAAAAGLALTRYTQVCCRRTCWGEAME